MFQPFFTTKDVGLGTGLGLATVYAIVQHHHGWMECRSQPGKANLFEGGTREPLVVVWPDRIPAGTRSDAFVSSIDFYPTFLELAGISLPETHHVDGISQIPVWCEDAESVREEVFCFFPHYTPATGQLPATSLRVGDWKLIRYFHDNPDQTHRYELFNLRDDLGETRNLAEKDPERVENMDARIEDFLRDTECVVPVKHETYDRAVEEAYEGWRNAVVVHKERNELKRDKTGLNFDATSFGPAFICEEIPENSGELICAITLQSDKVTQMGVVKSPGMSRKRRCRGISPLSTKEIPTCKRWSASFRATAP